MSQHDFNIANQGFPATRSDINNALAALASTSSGTSEPSTTYANQFWYDTTNNLLKFRNEANSAWITLAYLDQGTNEWEIRSSVIRAVDSAGVIIKTDDGTARVTINDDGTTDFGNDVDITGTLTSDGLTVDGDSQFGNSGYLIYNNANPDITLRSVGGTTSYGNVILDANGRYGSIQFRTGYDGSAIDNEQRMKIDTNGDISFYEDTGTTPKFFWDAAAESLGLGSTTPDSGRKLHIEGGDTTVGITLKDTAGTQYGIKSDANSFIIRNDNLAVDRLTIDSSGNVGIGCVPTYRFEVDSGGSVAAARLRRSTDGTLRTILLFLSSSNSNTVGSVSINNTSTSYNTSSDHRLKENVVGLTGATDRLKQLEPKRFNFIADADTTVDGFLAHEVQSVVPEAITGTHNEVDADGNPIYQGIDQSKLVPLLVATIKELEARITALEAS